jgi:hypothetical protein
MAGQYNGDLPGMDYFPGVVRTSLLTEAGIHEAGHAILDAVNGTNVGDIRVWIVGEGVAGYVKCEPPTDETLPGWLIASSAGQVAEAMWLAKYRQVTYEQAMADCKPNACGDMEMFRTLGGKNPPISLELAQRQAFVVLTHRWPLVERYAIMLARSGQMDGSQVTRDIRRGR